jgi:hypothetical protein
MTTVDTIYSVITVYDEIDNCVDGSVTINDGIGNILLRGRLGFFCFLGPEFSYFGLHLLS